MKDNSTILNDVKEILDTSLTYEEAVNRFRQYQISYYEAEIQKTLEERKEND